MVDDESACLAAQNVFKSLTKMVKQEEFFACLINQEPIKKRCIKIQSCLLLLINGILQNSCRKGEAGQETRSLP